MGYGRMGVSLHEALTNMGVDVYDKVEGPGTPNVNEAMLEADNEAVHGDDESYPPRRHKRTNVVAWASVPSHARGWWRGQHSVCLTMWETMRLPEAFRENLHELDQLLVPSEQNVELFSRYHPDVSLVPLGIDPRVWHYLPRRPPETSFNFLIGWSGARKGTDLAVRAFRKLWNREGSWGSGPEPRLILKSPKPEDHYGRGISRVGGRITNEEEVGLYARAHCYLQPSRGEGFGLQPLQAMAQGIPTILTDAHGHAGFAHLGIPIPAGHSKAAYFIFGEAGEWWEPDFDALCDRMRWVYDHYDEAVVQASLSAATIAERWTWANTARRFVEAIGEDRLSAPFSGDGSWVVPERRLFRVQVSKPWQADIAGTLYQFTPGRDYYEPADIKRVLYEAGLLDPVCADEEDNGLSEAQVASMGAYKAEREHCELCGQRLGSGVTKADELYAAMAP